MSSLVAGDVKKRGVSAFAAALKDNGEAVITVHGKSRYVVMTMEKYNQLREEELIRAVREAREDYKTGHVADKSIDDHMRRLDDAI